MLSVDRLRVLYAVARNGSLNQAAEELHVTNSAVSQQLAKLEREVGQPLLERNGRGVRLTETGQILAEHTGRILSMVRQAEAEAEAHRAEAIGHLVLSSIPTAARDLVAPTVAALGDSHPQLQVEIREQEPEEAIPAVDRGESDAAVVIDWAGAPLQLPHAMRRAPLMEDVADIALPADHPLAYRDSLELDEVVKEPWITWRHNSACHDWLCGMLRARGVEPNFAHVAEEHQTKLAMVAAGLGATVIPRLGVGPPPEGVRLIPVRPALTRHVYVFWRADASRRPAIRATVRALKETAVRVEG